MTVDDLITLALGRVGEVTPHYPSSRGAMVVRVGTRQRWLFARAAKINPERFGVCATSNIVNGMVDLNDMAEPTVTIPEIIQAVTIEDKGSSSYTNGDLVNIVTVEDMNAELPPRALLRDGVIIGVGTDLTGVTSLKVSYARLSPLYTRSDGGQSLHLVAPWDMLLEIDLARWVLAKATQIAAETRAAAIAALDVEEKALLADFDQHVAEYTPTVSRFARPRVLAEG